jgi:hypothetical protein
MKTPALYLMAAIFLNLMLSSYTTASDLGTSLCTVNEAIVFSCTVTNHKIASLCASKDLTSTSGYLQYRFGRNTSSIDLKYPKQTASPKGKFKYSFEGFAKGQTAILAFDSSEYTYSVFRATSALESNNSGVIVERHRQFVAYIPCNERLHVVDNLYDLSEKGFSVLEDPSHIYDIVNSYVNSTMR